MKKTVNLFAGATVKVSPVKKAAEKKLIGAPELGTKIKKFCELKETIEAATAEIKMVEGDIKTAGKSIFLKEYKAEKVTPETFRIADASGSTVMFIVNDKYTTVDENKAEVLGKFKGLLTETTTYTMNAELVEKYAKVLSAMILKSKEITEDDKMKLIAAEKSFSVTKGSIDKILNFVNPEHIFELINPVVSLKR